MVQSHTRVLRQSYHPLKELEAEARSHNGQDDRQAYTDHSFHSQRMLDGAIYDSNTIGVLQFSCAMKKKYTNSNHHRRCLLDRFILVPTNNIVPISDVVRESGDPRALVQVPVPFSTCDWNRCDGESRLSRMMITITDRGDRSKPGTSFHKMQRTEPFKAYQVQANCARVSSFLSRRTNRVAPWSSKLGTETRGLYQIFLMGRRHPKQSSHGTSRMVSG